MGKTIKVPAAVCPSTWKTRLLHRGDPPVERLQGIQALPAASRGTEVVVEEEETGDLKATEPGINILPNTATRGLRMIIPRCLLDMKYCSNIFR